MSGGKNPTQHIINTFMTAPSGGLGSVLPEGVVGYDRPLSEHDYVITDPMDQKAIDEILYKVVCDTRQSMEPGTRLYIIMGEEHTTPIHRLTQAGLLDNLAEAIRKEGKPSNSLLYASETAYNDLQAYVCDHYGIDLDEETRARLHEHDPLGHYFTQAAMGPYGIYDAGLSLRQLFNRCLQNNIPHALVDAACDETESYLCPSDKLACKIAQNLDYPYNGYDLSKDKVCVTDNDGMVIRNAVMARRIVAAAEQHKADTIVIGTGCAHLGGNRGELLPYHTSLTGFLSEEIRPQDIILPVFFSSQEDYYSAEYFLPGPFWLYNPQSVVIRGTSEKSYQQGEQWYNKSALSLLYNLWAESRFIKKLGKSYTSADQPAPARFTLRMSHAKTVQKKLEQFIVEINQTAPDPL